MGTTTSSGGSSNTPAAVSSTPTASAPVSQPATQSRAAAASPKGISQCRGLFDYNTDDPNELSFKEGDIITVLQKDPSGWWQGELNGKIGVFPSVDWVEEFGVPGSAAGAGKKCRALYNYTADNEFELTIKPGDVLTIEGDEEGWYS